MEGQGQSPGGGGDGGQQQGGGGGGGKRRRRRRRGGGGGGGQNQNREGGGQPGEGGGGGGGQPQQARDGRPRNPQRDQQQRGGGGGGGQPGEGGGRNKDRGRRDRGGRDRGGRDREDRDRDRGPPMDPRLKSYEKNVPKNEPAFKHVKHRYGLVVFDKLDHAKADLEGLRAKAKEFDQLNIVIRAEGGMDDPDLNGLGNVKVFAGTAWALIHDRRKEEGWYEEPR